MIENSIRYGGPSVTAKLDCQEIGNDLLLTYEDDGRGIPVEEKERIFEKGFGKGTGLGLFLSREILAITGISIRETGLPGKGARFEILVPLGDYRFDRCRSPADEADTAPYEGSPLNAANGHPISH